MIRGYKSINGVYVYNGPRAESRPVKEWYPHDMEIRSSDHISLGAMIEYHKEVNANTTIGLKTRIDYLRSHVGDRLLSSFGVQLIF